MFFSVLVPVYNAEQYIDRCIKSIVEQSEDDYEIILVNDGSTDGSLEKCLEWGKKYPNLVKVINKNNTGSLETRRTCLNESSGEYIYIIDADDYIADKQALADIKNSIQANNVDMVIFNATTDINNKQKIYDYPFKNGHIYENEELSTFYTLLLEGTQLNTLWNKVFSRTLVDWDEDYSFRKEVIKGTDFYQVLPIISSAKRILYLDKVFYLYNTNNGTSISHSFNPLMYKNTCLQHLRLEKFSEGWPISKKTKNNKINTRFTSDVAKIILTLAYADDYSVAQKIDFLKHVKEDDEYIKRHTLDGLPSTRRPVIQLLDKEAYRTLLAYIGVSRLINRVRIMMKHI